MSHLTPPFVIYLLGDLGAGKTTLVRHCLQSLGLNESIKSPTFSLLESYSLPQQEISIFHLDLYRLKHAEELEYIGIRDYWNDKGIWFIEWPLCAVAFIPEPDWVIEFAFVSEQSEERLLTIQAISNKGAEQLK